MHKLSDITRLDIETINNCNALCPLCVRGTGMDTNDKLDWRLAFGNIPQSVWDQFDEVCYNGTTGDNLLHPEIYEAVEWTAQHTTALISLHTNGSVRSANWWAKFGAMLKDHHHKVVFALDGLEDTHSIYRVNTNWQTVINNATAFINAGGNAEWQFIIFKHNQHQVDACRDLANKLGFKNFFVLYQDRFDSSGKKDRVEKISFIPPESRINPRGAYIPTQFKNQKNKPIDCYSKKIGWISLYADGTVWPCCWLMGWHKAKQQGIQFGTINYHFKKFLELDFAAMSLYNKSLDAIISSDPWANKFPDSFVNNPNPICIQQCSK